MIAKGTVNSPQSSGPSARSRPMIVCKWIDQATFVRRLA
jgi:hypothetical protein